MKIKSFKEHCQTCPRKGSYCDDKQQYGCRDMYEEGMRSVVAFLLEEGTINFYSNEKNYEPQDYKGVHNIPTIGNYKGLSDNGIKARQLKQNLEELL